MGSGISTSRQKEANQTLKDSESVVGQSLASVLSSPDGRTTDDNERLQYPENVHAALDVERYVVDENGLRNLFGGDVSRPNGVWWNDAVLAAEVKSVERTLSTPRRESSTRQHEKAHGKRASDVEPERLVTADDEVPCLPARLVEETWDRFPSGYIQAPSLELSQPSRPCTPPNLTRIIQENVSAAGYAAYRFRRVAELTAPQLAESFGLLGLSDNRYAAIAKEEGEGREEEEEEEEGREEGTGTLLEQAGSDSSISFSLLEGMETRGSDTWSEGHGLSRWRQEFDQARSVIRTKLAIKDSRGSMVMRKPPPPPEEEESEE